MLFAIDIDQTIAGGSDGFRVFVEHHIQDLKLDIPSHTIDSLTDYRSFLHLPEVIAYRKTNEARFQESRESCRISPRVISSLSVIAGATTGVAYLSHIGKIHYYTIRANEIQEATKQWLFNKGFPNPCDVSFCMDTPHKLLTLYHQETKEDTIVLIDDRYTFLLRGFENIAREQPHIAENLRQRLILVAFGIEADALPAHSTSLKVLTLPSWDSITTLTTSLRPRAFVQNS